ncbi:MAG: DUF192 domain-containing protein [Gemmatimonadales bacterium]|nr:DUF192 domain-containing protein [Gemmatimonadales bacterium]
MELGQRVGIADRWWSRLRGLLGRPPLEEGEGLLLVPCRSVHMLGMSFALDVAFLDSRGRVIALYHELQPGSRTRWHRPARYALELAAGTLAATHTGVGDTLEWGPLEVPAGATPSTIAEEVTA